MRAGNRHPLLVMVSPLVAWALHLVLVYSLVGLRCGAPPAWLPRLGGAALDWGSGLATLAVLLAIAAAANSGWQRHRDAHEPSAPRRASAHERDRFVGMVTLLLALVAIIAMGFTVLPLLMLEPCR